MSRPSMAYLATGGRLGNAMSTYGAMLSVKKRYKIDTYVKRTGKASLLIFLLATIIAIATAFALGIALLRLSDNDWCFPGMKDFCSITDDTAEITCKEQRMLGNWRQFFREPRQFLTEQSAPAQTL